jgi:hypothetical protein
MLLWKQHTVYTQTSAWWWIVTEPMDHLGSLIRMAAPLLALCALLWTGDCAPGDGVSPTNIAASEAGPSEAALISYAKTEYPGGAKSEFVRVLAVHSGGVAYFERTWQGPHRRGHQFFLRVYDQRSLTSRRLIEAPFLMEVPWPPTASIRRCKSRAIFNGGDHLFVARVDYCSATWRRVAVLPVDRVPERVVEVPGSEGLYFTYPTHDEDWTRFAVDYLAGDHATPETVVPSVRSDVDPVSSDGPDLALVIAGAGRIAYTETVYADAKPIYEQVVLLDLRTGQKRIVADSQGALYPLPFSSTRLRADAKQLYWRRQIFPL